MSLRLLIVLSSLLFQLASSAPGDRPSSYDYGFDAGKLAKRQSTQPLIVRGVTRRDHGIVPIRKEIRELEKNKEQWTLYLLAQSMLQYTNQDDPLSWYQLTGIHGVPFVSWGGVQPLEGMEFTGYCTHQSVLFPSWHRPYLALYEQVLFNVIQRIASWYPKGPERDRYLAAAKTFRIPYWDWAVDPPAGGEILPRSVWGAPAVEVAGPNGVQTIANPLYSYRFKPLDAEGFLVPPFNLWKETYRSPSTLDSSAKSNGTVVSQAMKKAQPQVQQRLYALFSNYANYTVFSNSGLGPNPGQGQYDSIESVHDTVHMSSGSGGHMSFVPFSAFDPVFFLHHAMVDRVTALWQAIYPNSWVEPAPATMDTWNTKKGQIQNSSTPLTPFFSDGLGNFWNSDMVRNHQVLGYTYAEFTGPNSSRRANVIAAVNKLYGSSSPASLTMSGGQVQSRNEAGLGRQPERYRPGGPAEAWHRSMSVPEGSVIVKNQYQEWTADIHVDKQALAGSFSIHLFLGEPPEDTSEWQSAPNLVGTMSVFTSPGVYGEHMKGIRTTGTVPLTNKLVQKISEGSLSSLQAAEIEPFLREHLCYRIMLPDLRPIDPRVVGGLKISIISTEVRAPLCNEELPQWGSTVARFDLI